MGDLADNVSSQLQAGTERGFVDSGPAAGIRQGRVQSVVAALVGAGLVDEEEIGTVIEDHLARCLAAVKGITKEDRAEGRQVVGMQGYPALGGVDHAVGLLLVFVGS